MKMSIRSLTYQHSVFKRRHSDKHLSQSFYLQDGVKNQLAQIWNKITPLSPHVNRWLRVCLRVWLTGVDKGGPGGPAPHPDGRAKKKGGGYFYQMSNMYTCVA